MTINELIDFINNGENSYVKFKEENVETEDLAEEIVAFANSEGGIILIGVDDEGKVIGVTNSYK